MSSVSHPQADRSRSLSILFDDVFYTILVTGKPLEFGDRHFPALTGLTIGSPSSDVVLTRRRRPEKRELEDDVVW